ncbi:tetratricopeptide repeat protein 9C-like [Anoplophora glabripennis]|uniref:FK506-binding like-protein n=1 Tax=Anoplophora glabripennis TaxID=217634 RepID=V5GC97_ANOGL|nr:tetratricopeptide repeat protein 9C-like [Anoplophora glabripennis]
MVTWTSPDGKIQKDILQEGKWGDKPSEGSRCTITITDSPFLEEFTNTVVTVGDNDGDLWRALDICLGTMFVGEKSKFSLNLHDSTITLILELIDLAFDGFIFQWDVSKKYNMALHHKEKGNDLFKNKNGRDAAFRFTKALKVLSSIPVDIEEPPDVIDGIPLSDINKLKANLFNNLSSCYFRNQSWMKVIDLCTKVFAYDPNNVKALYKIGVAYQNDRDFEKAKKAFCRVLELEPGNKACAEHLDYVRDELRQAEIKVNNIMKKMFGA